MQRKKEIEYIYLMEKKPALFHHSFIPTKFRSNKGYSSRSQVLLYTECQKVLSYNIVVAHYGNIGCGVSSLFVCLFEWKLSEKVNEHPCWDSTLFLGILFLNWMLYDLGELRI